jgi:hypothetical protein
VRVHAWVCRLNLICFSDHGPKSQDLADRSSKLEWSRRAVDATGVYWSTEATAGIMKCAVSGCSNAPTLIMSAGIPEMTQAALDTDNIYFVEYSPLGLGQVLACAKTG